jgi:transposase-like protein
MSKKIHCPECGACDTTIKHGATRNGTQRYRCKACGKTFITNTSPTKYLKNSDYTIRKLIGYMIDDVALDVIARNLKINIKTAHYYRYLVFHSLKGYQDEIRLSGSIMIDETFMRIKENEYKLKRMDGKGIRGLSFNQLCIITLTNLQGLCTAKISSRAMAMPDDYKRLFNQNLYKVKRFLHDGNPRQVQFMNQFSCEKIDTRRDESGDYSTYIIDSLHSNIKRYLFKHAGYRMKNLQHYLNFFVYRYNQLILACSNNKTQQLKAKNRIVDDLFERIIKGPKVITYQTYLNDKGIMNILESRLD